MDYEQTLHYLYTRTPVFQHIGAPAYKPGLDTSIALDNYSGNPHRAYRCLHVGGTNGKGSVCHTLAAILRQAGYRVGLYTSPHLKDFRERIRVDGKMIDPEYVTGFVERSRSFSETLQPSFFELTSAMAFEYFRAQKVDFAVIEVGLGGRLDSTNIITPLVSVVTNISLDHTQFLGKTTKEIAYEKAGIIKPGVPFVVGDTTDEGVYEVFRRKAEEMHAPLFRADKEIRKLPELCLSPVQALNVRTILAVLQLLSDQSVALPFQAVEEGFRRVSELTGLRGRWEIVSRKPFTVLDTGHNEGAWNFLPSQIALAYRNNHCRRLILMTGFSEDKDIDLILDRMPPNAYYLFTQASLPRALPAANLAAKARTRNLKGEVCPTVAEAFRILKQIAAEDDFVFIGGSNFIVADALHCLDNHIIN
ncbi:MAG: bifunctional folylpolyglutamate synthase/dihydrofolate synthase [Tannerellaceae bacterium]|jgi:dihydrofolate synthase/folylpolyglutamate synthase|nr:bifunctional folylpolyglutamate synthase/dihydrofolate synthase [Tannerellaceae bacterium]